MCSTLPDIESLSPKGTYFSLERFLPLGQQADPILPSTFAFLASLIRHFAPLVCVRRDAAYEMMRNGAPIDTYVTSSNIAFLVLVFQHYISRWKWEAARKRKKLPGADQGTQQLQEDPPELHYSDGIAGKTAKAKFAFLRGYFQVWFFMKSSSKAASNMRTLSKAVRKIGPPSSFIVMAPQRRLSDDDIVGDIVHSVFYQLHF